MAVVTASPVEPLAEYVEHPPLSDELVPAFLDELTRSGVRRSARAVGIYKSTAYQRRYDDSQFRQQWAAAVAQRPVIQAQRLQLAADELMWALEDLAHVAGGWEGACDQLINCSFTGEDPPACRSADPDVLAAARDRLSAAGKQWAALVFEATR